MEFDEHRRMYSINIGDHTHPLGFGNHGTTSIHLHQTQTLQPEHHPRLLVGSMIDGAVVAISPQINHHSHSLQQPIHHTIIPHHPHLSQQAHQHTQLSHQSVEDQALQQTLPVPHVSNIQPHLVRVAEEKELTTENELNENALINAENLDIMNPCEQQTVRVEANTSVRNRWCFVCNVSLPDDDSSEVVDILATTVNASHRKLSAVLTRLTGIRMSKTYSTVICQRCFSLLNEIDTLEIKLADAKMTIRKDCKNTLTLRQSDVKALVDPVADDEVPLETSCESEVEDDAADPDVTPSSLQNKPRSRTVKRSKKKNKTGKDSNLSRKCLILKDQTEPLQKRGRGRPRRKKEENDTINPDEPSKECPCCQKVLVAGRYLSHLSIHRVFPCPFCRTVFKKKDIKTHIAESHQEEIHYPCTECDQVCSTFMQLRKHCLIIHMGVELERAQCSLCVKKFSSRNALKVHIDTIHSKKQLYECQICKESFNQRGNMRNHFRRVHQGVESRKLRCSLCAKGFICPSDLRKHVERVHLKIRKSEVICKVCSKPFSDSRALKIHMNAIHTKEVQYPCPDCNMVFHSLTNMVTHRRRMHRGNEARKHICTLCSKGFCSPSDLRTHVKVVHENIRKFICDICGQTFKVGSHLKYHRRKHTGETPYNCPHCDKSFHGPSHISDHIKKVHKTVYMGVNQRRRLNLPEDAPPPPPGILSSRHRVKQMVVATEEMPPAPTQIVIQPTQPQQSSSAISHVHPGMMAFSSHPNQMLQASNTDSHSVGHNQWWTVANYL